MTRFALCEVCGWPLNECSCERSAEQARARRNDSRRTGYVKLGGTEAQAVVPCRRCGDPVEISEWVFDVAREVCDPYLARRGEEPLRDNELTLCSPCGELHAETQRRATEEELRDRDQRWARSLEAGAIGRFDREWLQRHSFHEDVRSLEEVIRKRKEKPTRARRAAQEDR